MPEVGSASNARHAYESPDFELDCRVSNTFRPTGLHMGRPDPPAETEDPLILPRFVSQENYANAVRSNDRRMA
jgi:hypothetical protein